MKFTGMSLLCLVVALASGSSALGDQEFTDAEQKVLNALNSQTTTSYLQSGENELIVSNSNQNQVFEFQKVTNGLPILGNVVTVVVDASGDIDQVIDDSTADLTTGSQIPQITGARAEEVAEGTLATLKAVDSSHEMVWFRLGDKAVLAWNVETNLAPSDAPGSPTHLFTVVDAMTGDLLSQSQKDMNIYTPDPKTGKGIFPRRIVINDAVGAAGSQAFALSYPEVCDIPGCTATLIAPNVLISARHCNITPGGTVNFGPNSLAPIFSTTIQSVTLPDGPGSLLDGGDVAIVVLNSNVPVGVATPMRFIDETTALVGMTAATVGYGANGVGSTGHMGTSDGLRWGGENVIDVYGAPADATGSNIISTDFDDGSNGNNTIGGSNPVPLPNEATTAPGDSGGPVIVNVAGENLIAGVLSGGTDSNSEYGDISWWTGTAIYRSQIEAAGGQFADSSMPPSNDNFANTIFTSLPIMEMGTNANATTEDGEQELDITSATVWWFFEAPETGMVTIDTFGSDFDTVLHIYEGFFPGATVADLIPVANNDQAGGTNQSEVSFPVVAGECYEIRVGGFFGDQGNIVLNGSMGAPPMPPANDDFNGTIFLGSFPFNTTGTNVDATTQMDEQQLEITSATVWWYFNAPGDGTVTIDTFGSDFDTVLHIYTGVEMGFANLVPVTDNDQAGGTNQSEVTFAVNGGQCYEVRVGGYLGAMGNITLNGVFDAGKSILLGDVNLDGEVNLLDVAPFVDLLAMGIFQAEADINQDGIVNLLDVQPFIDILAGA